MADKTVTVRLQATTAQYQSQMASATASTRAFGTTVGTSLGGANKSLGGMTRLGGGIRNAIANPLGAIVSPAGAAAAALALSAKAAIDWESAWTGVTKTVEGTPAQMGALEQGLRDLTGVLPASHQEIAGVAEAAGALGIETENILGFTRTMIDLGETTNLTSEQAATTLAKLANITGMAQDKFDNLGSALVALGNDGASTEDEIANMALRIAGAGNQIGLTESQILGFAAALSDVGIHAEMGGSAISRVMVKLSKAVDLGGEDLQKFAAVAGMSSQQFASSFRKDAPGAIVAFVTGLGQMEKHGMSAFSVLEKLGVTEQRTSDTLLRLAGSSQNLARSQQTSNTAFRENTALAEEAEKRYATTAAQLETFKNEVVDLAINIGGILLPAINFVLGPLGEMVDFLAHPMKDGLWGDLSDEVDTMVADLKAMAENGSAFVQLGDHIGDAGSSIASAFSTIASADIAHSSSELRLLSEAFDDTEKEAEELTDAINTLIGVHLNLDDAAVQFQAGLADLRDAIEENGDTLDITTEKGRENRSAFTSAAQGAVDLANAQIEAGASTEKATRNLQGNIKELKAEAIAAGLSEDAVDSYIKRLNLTPDSIKTLIQLFDEEAQRKLNSVRAKMEALNGKTVTTFVNVVTRAVGGVAGNIAGTLSGQEVRHAGGEVGTSGARRYYMGAPSVRGDEVPAILQRGEVVLSRANVAAAQSSAPGPNFMEGRMRLVGDKAYIQAIVREELRSKAPPPRPVGHGPR